MIHTFSSKWVVSSNRVTFMSHDHHTFFKNVFLSTTPLYFNIDRQQKLDLKTLILGLKWFTRTI